MSLTAHQKRRRSGLITSSIAAAVMGEHDYATQIDAWRKIKGLADNDDDDRPDFLAKASERGDVLEAIVIAQPLKKYGYARKRKPAFIRHPDKSLPFGDSADAIYIDAEGNEAALGEGKTAAMLVARNYGAEETDEMPMGTLIQSHWHLLHRPHIAICHVPILVGGFRFEFRHYTVRRDDEFLSSMVEDCARWYRDYIIGDRMPPATGRASDEAYLKERFERASKGLIIEDSPAIEQWARQKVEARRVRKSAEELETEAENNLRVILGNAEEVNAQWGKVTWKNRADVSGVRYGDMIQELRATGELSTDRFNELERVHSYTAPGARTFYIQWTSEAERVAKAAAAEEKKAQKKAEAKAAREAKKQAKAVEAAPEMRLL